jgi:hypothetical protein
MQLCSISLETGEPEKIVAIVRNNLLQLYLPKKELTKNKASIKRTTKQREFDNKRIHIGTHQPKKHRSRRTSKNHQANIVLARTHALRNATKNQNNDKEREEVVDSLSAVPVRGVYPPGLR